MLSISQPLYIYLYDLPKHFVTSVCINKIIKEMTTTSERPNGFEVNEPVQFKPQRLMG